MATVNLNTKLIHDWTSFHLVCKESFGFPEFYGMNMNAWIDCLTYLDEEQDMSNFCLDGAEMLHIEISDTEDFKARVPEIFNALVESTAFVNGRYIDNGKLPVLSLVFI